MVGAASCVCAILAVACTTLVEGVAVPHPLGSTGTLENGEVVVRPRAVGSVASAVRECADVAANVTHADARAVRCILDTRMGWPLTPGSDTNTTGPLVLPHLNVPLIITASDPELAVSGIQWLPDRWEPSTASPHAGVWRQTLPRTFVTESGSVEQLFARVDGSSGSGSSGDDVQWMSEARWPNARLGVGEVATAHGSPLDPTTWATTKENTDLRSGVIVDSALPAGVNWTGALATLNVGYRFLTWTREVLWANHTAFRWARTWG
jgi:hypothetical protein